MALSSLPIRYCVDCGQAFEPRRKTQTHCSAKCRRHLIEIRRRKHLKEAQQSSIIRHCEVCGTELTKNQIRTCCRVCSLKTNLICFHICQYCGRTFKPKASDRTTYCSRACAFMHKTEIKRQRRREAMVGSICVVWPITCKQCGRRFIARYQATQLCSEECRTAWHYEYKRIYTIIYGRAKKGENKRICKSCGNEFTAPYSDKRRSFCSRECGKRFFGRIHKKTRRARLKGCEAERINPLEVFERDGWICGICGKKVNPNLKHPHHKSVALDHVIPLSLGGPHTWGNVQCSHFICNSRKSDGGQGQLHLGLRG